jgi:hypothetical protein
MTILWRLLHALLELTAEVAGLTQEIKGLREDLTERVPVRAAFRVGVPVAE